MWDVFKDQQGRLVAVRVNLFFLSLRFSMKNVDDNNICIVEWM